MKAVIFINVGLCLMFFALGATPQDLLKLVSFLSGFTILGVGIAKGISAVEAK